MVPAQQDAMVAGLCATVADVAALTPRERALVAYADILTLKPQAVRAEHIAALRDAGCDDRAIHDACAIVGYFAFVNRMADGLGVELEGLSGGQG
jgi:alkylhydroperoxidase family enzyme